MSVSPRMAWSLAAALALLALIPAGWAWASAARAERVQIERLASISAKVRSIADLRSTLPDWTLTPKSSGTLAPQVSAALAAAGLPASTMGSLSADSGAGDTPSPKGNSLTIQARVRRATLQLAGLTLPQLGKFLQTWREREPAWVVSQIDVAPESTSEKSKAAQSGGDLPLRATLTLETLTLERGGAR